MSEVAATPIMQQLPTPANPFSRERLPSHVNAGAVAIEEARAVAEAQGKLVIAKRFPRNPFQAFERVLEACKRPGVAAAAFYSYPRGNKRVTGPSIRLAEELARCWGNIDYGLRELSNREGVSEMEAYAWDLETNTHSSQKFTVRHIRDSNEKGAQELTDQRDIYEITANLGARRLRARILSVLPDDIVDAAVKQCQQTIAGSSDKPLVDRARDMVARFATHGISLANIETYLGHPLASILPDEFTELFGIYNGIKDGTSKPSDFFGATPGSAAGALN